MAYYSKRYSSLVIRIAAILIILGLVVDDIYQFEILLWLQDIKLFKSFLGA